MMSGVPIQELLDAGVGRLLQGDPTTRLFGVRHDSREIRNGELFVALVGQQHDGARFVTDAIDRGASAVLAEQPLELKVPFLKADNARLALAQAAALVYGDPTAKICVIGITGTNGKTTTSYLLHAALNEHGAKPARIGTVGISGPGVEQDATHTTPEADELMRWMLTFADNGADHVVMEVSSHALAQHRADGVHFEVAAFLNLSPEHLDYHGNMAAYADAKKRLFYELRPHCAVVCIDDVVGQEIASTSTGTVVRCSKNKELDAEIKALRWTSSRKGLEIEVTTPQGMCLITSSLLGDYNVENLLVALGCGLSLGIPLPTLQRAFQTCGGVPGRLERVATNNGSLVVVDYAHTPDALKHILRTLRAITKGRLTVVFGCGGNRDALKRPLMGAIAGELADRVVITNDNPRSENPLTILSAIEEGLRESGIAHVTATDFANAAHVYTVEPNRAEAIRLAVSNLAAGDTLLIAGKGHETVQIVGDQRTPFDDRLKAQEALRLVGFGTGDTTKGEAS